MTLAPRIRTESLDPERFAHPEAGDRPGVRWWWQGRVSTEEMSRQLRAIAEAGFREVEIAFSRGLWGDEEQREALGAILREVERLGVRVAMTLGASWPLKTPNTTTGTGFSTRELQYGSVLLRSGSSGQVRLPAAFDDLDGARPSTLVRVTAARVVQQNEPPMIVPLDDPYAPPRGVITPSVASTVLEAESLVDLTPQHVASEIFWEAHECDWTLFAFWMRDCEQGVTSFLDGRAAQAATEYLDEHQIGAENLELLRKVGTELFEDSLELNADSVFWTPDMLERFIERHGYDVTPYLPLLFAHGMCRFWVPNEEPTPDFELDTGVGARVRRDYYRLLTDLYISRHLLPLQEWSASHGLGVDPRARSAGVRIRPARRARAVRCCVQESHYRAGSRRVAPAGAQRGAGWPTHDPPRGRRPRRLARDRCTQGCLRHRTLHRQGCAAG
jgi:hypothetical protein